MSEFLDGELRNRWIEHRLEPVDLKYMLAGEEMRVLYIALTVGRPSPPSLSR
ncbi:MAG TPA: hypothetical protein VEX18_16280 [Polyangiaceae bacterium]|nr:hypothetical protein [Polyangiaceae bacterium]